MTYIPSRILRKFYFIVVFVSSQNPSKLSSHGAGFCPRLLRSSSELLAADGAKTDLTLITENLPTPRSEQLGFQCVISIEGATMVVGARVFGEPTPKEIWGGRGSRNRTLPSRPLRKVVCDPTIYRYEAEEGQYESTVTLVWNQNHVVDNKPLTLYKCGVLASHRGHQDCSLCVTRPTKFHCNWCGSACRFASNCPASAAQPLMHKQRYDVQVNENTGLNQCPTPRIDVVSVHSFISRPIYLESESPLSEGEFVSLMQVEYVVKSQVNLQIPVKV